MNWVEELAWNMGCSTIICGGDFFDSSQLNSEEISALRGISWAPLPHIYLTGNHETNVSSLEYSTTDIFNLCPTAVVISKPEYYHVDGTDVEFAFLPYILEKDRQPLNTYFPERREKRIIFSHNDLKNVQYGAFLSTEGFTIEEIEENCDLFLNGHIHHCCYVTSKIINGGNLTGQNFTEDAYKYDHCVQVIDTDTLKVDFYLNPYAFNFYKLDCTSKSTIEDCINDVFLPLKNNSVVTVKVSSHLSSQVRQYLETVSKDRIVEYRLIVEPDAEIIVDQNTFSIEAVDHLKQFENYVMENIGNTNIIREELGNVLR